jgi:iron(III) transport system permease protein
MSAFTRHLGANYTFTLEHFKAVWQNAGASTIRTMLLAMASSAIVSIGGLIIAYIITRSRIYGRGMLDLLSTFIFAVPGTFIGIGYALAFSHPPLVLSGTWTIILACIVIRTLPIGVRSGVSAIMQQDYVLEEASASLGASKLKTFLKVVVPIARPALLVSAIYTFVMTIQTVGAIIFIISPGKKVLSVEAFESIVSMRFGQSGALASIMLGIGAAGMFAIYAIGHKEDVFVWLRKSITMKSQV